MSISFILARRVVPRLRHHHELPQQVPGGQHGGESDSESGPGKQGEAGLQPRLLRQLVFMFIVSNVLSDK